MLDQHHHAVLASHGLPADGPGHERMSFAAAEAWLLLAKSRGQPLADAALSIRTVLALTALGHRPDQEEAFFVNQALDDATPAIVAAAPDTLTNWMISFERLKVFARLLADPGAEREAHDNDVFQDFADDAAMLADLLDFLHRQQRLRGRGLRIHALEQQFRPTYAAVDDREVE